MSFNHRSAIGSSRTNPCPVVDDFVGNLNRLFKVLGYVGPAPLAGISIVKLILIGRASQILVIPQRDKIDLSGQNKRKPEIRGFYGKNFSLVGDNFNFRKPRDYG